MYSKPILHLSPAKEMKCSFLYYVQLLMIGWAGRWTQTPSITAFQPKMWNALFFITFYIWCWPDWSMDLNLMHHPSPAKKMKSSFLGYVQLLMISRACWWTQTPSATPLQPIKWNAHFWITFNFWWLARLVDGLKPHPPPLSYQKNKMLNFQLHSTSDDQPGWSMNSNPICHPSPAKKMKCSSLDYIQLLMIGWTGRWTQTPSATPLQPKTWNATFCITFNFWCWPDLSMDLNPIHHPSTAKKMKCSFFGLRSTSDDWLGWVMDSNPIHHPSPAKKMKCSFLDYVQLLMISWAGW